MSRRDKVSLAELDTVPDTERLIQLRLQQEQVTARVYTPSRRSRQTVLLVSGLHPAGIDESRLVAFAHGQASAVLDLDVAPSSQFFEAVTPAPACDGSP